jgi:hypothetical protein
MPRPSRKHQAVKHQLWSGNTREEIQAFNESYSFNLDEVLADIERAANDILTAANFPQSLKPPFSPPDIVLKQQIEERGFGWESREGYAVRIMYQTWLVRTALPKPDAVAIHAMVLGSLITQSTMHGHWERGLSLQLGSLKGAELAWGSPEEREKKKNEIRKLYNDQRRKCRSNEDAYRAIERQTGVEARTVRRIITGH